MSETFHHQPGPARRWRAWRLHLGRARHLAGARQFPLRWRQRHQCRDHNAVCLAHRLMEGGRGWRPARPLTFLAGGCRISSPFRASGESGAEVSAALKLMLRVDRPPDTGPGQPARPQPAARHRRRAFDLRPPAPGKPGPPVHRGHPCQHSPASCASSAMRN